MNRDAAEPEGPWIAPDIMKHPETSTGDDVKKAPNAHPPRPT
jgi:hypothetical protein